MRHLSAAGIPFDCLERENDLGGNWNLSLACSRIMESTHLISSKKLTEYPDHPMPDDWPEFPSHRLVLEYLQSYADRFDLRRHIEFGTAVSRVERPDASQHDDASGWIVTLASGERRHYGKLIIANGHNWDPCFPDYSGEFTGQILHSGEYKQPDVLRDKRVLVVGGGNSGSDIAVESSRNARQTSISLRRGYHVLPKFFHGTPIDVCGERLQWARTPLWLRRLMAKVVFYFLLGTRQGTGLPKPDHKLFETHPTISSQLIDTLRHGDLTVRPDVERLCGASVRFIDGTEEPFDLIIYATGYHLSFPFIAQELLSWREGRPDFYLNVFHPEADDLFVLGMLQPDSGQWGLVDRQAQLITRYLQASQQKSPAADRFRQRKRQGARREPISFLNTTRHLIQVEHYSYRRELDRELKKFG